MLLFLGNFSYSIASNINRLACGDEDLPNEDIRMLEIMHWNKHDLFHSQHLLRKESTWWGLSSYSLSPLEDNSVSELRNFWFDILPGSSWKFFLSIFKKKKNKKIHQNIVRHFALAPFLSCQRKSLTTLNNLGYSPTMTENFSFFPCVFPYVPTTCIYSHTCFYVGTQYKQPSFSVEQHNILSTLVLAVVR